LLLTVHNYQTSLAYCFSQCMAQEKFRFCPCLTFRLSRNRVSASAWLSGPRRQFASAIAYNYQTFSTESFYQCVAIRPGGNVRFCQCVSIRPPQNRISGSVWLSGPGGNVRFCQCVTIRPPQNRISGSVWLSGPGGTFASASAYPSDLLKIEFLAVCGYRARGESSLLPVRNYQTSK
jgi:hypothetical protein